MTEPAIISNLDDERLIRDGEGAVDQYNRSRDQARRQIMPMARGLSAAKRKYPATQDFGDWLQTSSYREIDEVERAALIKIGEHELFASKFIPTTRYTSPRTIWDAIQALLPTLHNVNSTNQVLAIPQIDAAASSTPLEPISASANDEKKEVPDHPRHVVVGQAGTPLKQPEKSELVSLLEITADEYVTLFGAYPDNRQRNLRGELLQLTKNRKKHGRANAINLFRFALDVVVSGQAAQLTNTAGFDPRLFMPKLPAGLAKTIPFKQVVERFDRLALMNIRCVELEAKKASALETHAELNHLWQTGTNLPPAKAAIVTVPETDSKSRIKHEVKFCGELIWPRESLRHVTYEDLNTGWHLTHYWLSHLEHATPQRPRETAVQIRHLMWDIREASSIAGLVDVMMACLAAFSKRNNDGKAQADLSGCIPPGRAR